MKKVQQREKPDSPGVDFPVVGIGASAGGLEALKRFLGSVPAITGMAYVFVQHLSPEHESALPLILGKLSKIPVEEIKDSENLQPDHLYVIPSNKILTLEDGKLKTDIRNESNSRIKIIDHFFSSLASVYQAFAVGIVLSGTLDDGSQGLKAIKSCGGISFAQDPDTAAYPDMPKNAIKTGVVDFVLPPEKMLDKLLEINHPFARAGQPGAKPTETETDEETFRNVIGLLRIRRGFDFTYYKQPTIKRRIARRMALSRMETTEDYLKLLKENREELNALFNDMLISVSNFFRDSSSFDLVCGQVIPALLAQKNGERPIRVWVAGCATGEEPYSIAMCLMEAQGERSLTSKIQIFATDISERAIAKARIGIYKKTELEGVSPTRLNQFFTKLDGDYQINKPIRELCIFAQHNFLKDPPFSKIDLISCRNVLIYLEPILQTKALTTFHYALNEKGFLVLGRSETVGANADMFRPYGTGSDKVYSRHGGSGRFMHVTSRKNEESMQSAEKSGQPDGKKISDIYKKADEAILSGFSLPGVLINDQFEIVQFRGVTDAWLSLPSGKASLNLLKMAREGLSFELRNLLHQVKTNNLPARKTGIHLNVNGKQQYVDIEALPLTEEPEPHFLVLFRNHPPPPAMPSAPASETPATGPGTLDARDIRIEQLEKELMVNREDMRNITEEQEAANEELQSANEELLSGSEELQTLNEELETSKEELQSTNEELTIVNHELLDRNEQLVNARKYADSIVRTVRDPLLVMDRHFLIKTANREFYKKFPVTLEETEGKNFFEFAGGRWNVDGLRQRLEDLPESGQFSDFCISQDFGGADRRELIINAHRDNVNGNDFILLAIEDVTDKKKVAEAMAALKQMNKNLERSNQELEQFAFAASHDLQEPVRKILTFSDYIEERQMDIPEDTKMYIHKIVAAGKRMEKLIHDLLNFSLVNDKTKLMATVSLNTIVKDVLTDVEVAVRDKQAVIALDDLPDIPGFSIQIHQLFYNLISNALKFSSPHQQPRIEIRARPLAPDELSAHALLRKDLPYYDITVRDNGIGIDKEYQDKIFVIFQRLHSVASFPGTGIGLALCRKIVQNHSGEIFVQSAKNEGSVFHVILPSAQ